MPSHRYFIAGTDTDAGKTFVATALLERANTLELTSLGLKPISAGCDEIDGELHNDDALKLMQASSVKLDYSQVNPFAFAPPIAPHIAAHEAGRRLSIAQIQGMVQGAMMSGRAELTLIEGAGGWRVPVNSREFLSRLPQLLDMPVILVVGMKLGCLNHARLTAEAIRADGLTIAGWVANCVQPEMPYFEENIASLRGLIPAPCLGVVPNLSSSDQAVAKNYLKLPLEL